MEIIWRYLLEIIFVFHVTFQPCFILLLSRSGLRTFLYQLLSHLGSEDIRRVLTPCWWTLIKMLKSFSQAMEIPVSFISETNLEMSETEIFQCQVIAEWI
jgi:hypothetical protein